MNQRLRYVARIAFYILLAGVLMTGAGIAAGGSPEFNINFGRRTVYTGKQDEYVKETVSLDKFEKIDLQSGIADVWIRQGESYVVSYDVPEEYRPHITVKDNCLTVVSMAENKFLQMNLSFFDNDDEEPVITVTIPEEAVLSDITVKTDTGNIFMQQIDCENVQTASDTGNVELSGVRTGSAVMGSACGKLMLSDCTGENAEMKADTGNCILKNNTFNSIKVEEDTGKIAVHDCNAAFLELSTDTGDIDADNLEGRELALRADTGKVTVNRSAFDRVSAECDTGDLVLHLIGSADDYDFDAETELSGIKLNGEKQGDRLNLQRGKDKWIRARSDTGSVDIEILN